MKQLISLFDCYNAKVLGDKIYCAKKHRLNKANYNGSIDVIRAARGDALRLTVCQGCPDADIDEHLLLPEEKGWIKK